MVRKRVTFEQNLISYYGKFIALLKDEIMKKSFKRILNKGQLAFIIEDTNGNVFGGYINSKIDKYKWKDGNEVKGSDIPDSKAFDRNYQYPWHNSEHFHLRLHA